MNPRKYTFNYEYFKKIDSEEKAYWLGFIYADGSVREISQNCGELRISLVTEGKKHLEKLAKALNYSGFVSGPYTMKWSYKGVARTSEYWSLTLCEYNFFKDLVNLGVVPNKTYLVQFPNIPTDLHRHFIRGLFDGDGCISHKVTKYRNKEYTTASMSIVGAVPPFLEHVVKTFSLEIGVKQVAVGKNSKKGSTWRFSYQGTPALRIRDWMYEGATVWMECKKDNFYSYSYSSLRPRDKEHQEFVIDKLAEERHWKRLSEYNGRDEDMKFMCDKGHIYETSVNMFKLEKGCRECMAIASGERMTEIGKDNIADIFANKGWKLLSEYVSKGKIQIQCEHGKVFTMNRRSSIQPHAQCDCIRTNSLSHGLRQLEDKLKIKKWNLLSAYNGYFKYVKLRCEHGKMFERLPGNIKLNSKCRCKVKIDTF